MTTTSVSIDPTKVLFAALNKAGLNTLSLPDKSGKPSGRLLLDFGRGDCRRVRAIDHESDRASIGSDGEAVYPRREFVPGE
jgi:hypothetical protein